MALNFPASPSTGDIHNASNNLSYFFDGVKWITQGSYNTGTINAIKLDSLTSSFNGSLTTFNLTSNSISVKPANALSVMISLGGVIQEPTTAYSLNSEAGTITFTSAPASNTAFFGIVYSRLPQLITTVDDGTITNAKVSTTAAIDKSKLDISDATTSVSGFMSTSDKTKLDGIEASATADQTNAEIRAAVEAATDSNVFTDADHTKLDGIEASATADQTASEIVALVAGQTIAPLNVNASGNVDLSSAESNSSNTSQFKLSNLTIGQHNNVGSYRFANASTGAFLYTANNHNFFDKDISKSILKLSTSAVELYHDNVKKCETSANGLNLPDNSKLQLGDSQDLKIYHSGNHSFVQETGTGNLLLCGSRVNLLNSATNGQMLSAQDNGPVELYYDSVLKAKTTADGVDVFNRVRVLGGSSCIHFNTDATGANTATRAMFGIAATTNNYIIGASTNDVVLNTPHRFVVGHASSEIMAIFDPDGPVELYHDAVKKVETTSSGITVQGSVTTEDVNMSNLNGTANEVDGSKGSWSIQEGADDLFLINRVSGKKYKFNLTEIT